MQGSIQSFDSTSSRYENSDGDALSNYLASVRRYRVLDREEAAALSRTIHAEAQKIRDALHAIPGTARRVLDRWHERRDSGRMTGLLAHGYHDDTQQDWNSRIDDQLAPLEALYNKWLEQPRKGPEARQRNAKLCARMAERLDAADILLEILLEIHDELRAAADGPTTAAARRKRRALGLTDADGRRHLREVAEARARRDEARRTFASHNLRLVVKLAKRYRHFGIPYLDLIQEGNRGLMRAVDKFDYTRGFTFSTFGVWWIEQALVRAVQNTGRTVRVPSHVHQEQRRYRAVEDDLRTTLQREPHLEEVAAQIGCSPEEAERIAACMMPVRSIDEPLGEEGGITLVDRLEAPEGPEPFEDHDRSAIGRVLRVGLGGLPERERQVLEWRFGLSGEETLTLREIGERIGLSRERVRQIQTKALALLRERPDVDQLAEHMDGDPDAA